MVEVTRLPSYYSGITPEIYTLRGENMVIYLTKQGTNKTSVFNTLEFVNVGDYLEAVDEHLQDAPVDTHKLILFAYELGRSHVEEEQDAGTTPEHPPTPFKFNNGQVIYRDPVSIGMVQDD